jgi:uncharacterized membrane protein
MYTYKLDNFGTFFSIIFPILFTIIFFAVFIVILMAIIKSTAQWNKNNHSPRLTVPATAVARRTYVRHSTHNTDHMYTSTNTMYYITFQVESGDRMEFQVPDYEFGMIIEGDYGKLTFQGTRYLSFIRENKEANN